MERFRPNTRMAGQLTYRGELPVRERWRTHRTSLAQTDRAPRFQSNYLVTTRDLDRALISRARADLNTPAADRQPQLVSSIDDRKFQDAERFRPLRAEDEAIATSFQSGETALK